jgi:hypothetical protein
VLLVFDIISEDYELQLSISPCILLVSKWCVALVILYCFSLLFVPFSLPFDPISTTLLSTFNSWFSYSKSSSISKLFICIFFYKLVKRLSLSCCLRLCIILNCLYNYNCFWYNKFALISLYFNSSAFYWISCYFYLSSYSFFSSLLSLYLSLAYSSLLFLSWILNFIFGILIKSSTIGLYYGSILSIHYITSCKSSEYLSGIRYISPARIFSASAKWEFAVNGGLKLTSS